MVNHIVRQVTSKIAILFRNRHCLPLNCRILYFRSLILPDFLYASNCFSAGISIGQSSRLEKLLKRAVRCVFGAPFMAPSAPYFAKLGFKSLEYLYCHKLLCLAWRCIYDSCNLQLAALFSPVSAVNTTRQSTNRVLKYPLCKTATGTRCASYCSIHLWNSLPSDSRTISNLKAFKRSLPENVKF